MKTLVLKYRFGYTTAGGAHRYDSSDKRGSAPNIGSIYLRGLKTPPEALTITVEAS